MGKFASSVKNVINDKFRFYIITAFFIVGLILIFAPTISPEPALIELEAESEFEVHFFFLPTCSHCHEQKEFNNILMQKYPSVKFVYHDASNPEEAVIFAEFAKQNNISQSRLAVPMTFFNGYHFIGFSESIGEDIESSLKAYILGETKESVSFKIGDKVTLPVLGEIDVTKYSLPILAIFLGFVDGFNPCAMWVLVYMISLIINLKDKKKIWLIVGSFVAASGILYFLFMTAWLNVFLYVGYLKPLTIIIGLIALAIGIFNIREYIKTKGVLVCKVGDVESKHRTMSKMHRIIHSPLTFTTIFGIIGLAFVVNSIEFACSSVIPAVFTQVLAISNLSTITYYLYILLYVTFFMLDDLIIFSLAAFAINTSIGDKYAKYCKLIGGIILIILGLLLTFAPQLLR